MPCHCRKSCVSVKVGGRGNLWSSEGQLGELLDSRRSAKVSGLHSAGLKDTSGAVTRDIRMISIDVLLVAQ